MGFSDLQYCTIAACAIDKLVHAPWKLGRRNTRLAWHPGPALGQRWKRRRTELITKKTCRPHPHVGPAQGGRNGRQRRAVDDGQLVGVPWRLATATATARARSSKAWAGVARGVWVETGGEAGMSRITCRRDSGIRHCSALRTLYCYLTGGQGREGACGLPATRGRAASGHVSQVSSREGPRRRARACVCVCVCA